MSNEIRKIGVIGAGQMGNGIAHVCALSGYDVALSDVSMEAAEKGFATIQRNMDRQVGRNVISDEDRVNALGRIALVSELKDMGDADLVIESASENEEVKRTILDALCPVLKPEALIATNTSSISITRLAAGTDRPGKFVGMHFMNPVPMMQLIELIHRRKHLQGGARNCHQAGQDTGQCRGFPGLHGQPHPAADDQ